MLIGILVYLVKPLSNVYFFTALIYFLGGLILTGNKNKLSFVLNGCAYFVGAEVLFRMTKGGLAYESSKYLVILFVLMGMFFKGISGKGFPYFVYLILLVPSVLVASVDLDVDANFRTNIAFALSGPVCLGLASLFFYNKKVSNGDIIDMLAYASLPIVSMTTYLFLYNPSIKETIHNTASNFRTSGGFGPNQVATILGLGMFTFTVRILLKSPNLFLKIFNMVFLGLLSYRAVITFSRGGVFAAVITIAAFLFFIFIRAKPRLKNKILSSFFLLIVCLGLTWFISSLNTGGLIDKRYANQDALGRDKGDVSTGRVELFYNELQGFVENPFLGIGASNTKYNREEGVSVVTHNEISRLLSEHGIMGILIIIILIFTPLSYRSINRKNLFFYAFLSFWFATINHSAIRLAAPAFFYSLALLNIKNEKRPIHRKRLIKNR